jgi:hypothetical protein
MTTFLAWIGGLGVACLIIIGGLVWFIASQKTWN